MSGQVRFSNTAQCSLVAEFVAHKRSGSIILTVDRTGRYLVTADVHGGVKVWDLQVSLKKSAIVWSGVDTHALIYFIYRDLLDFYQLTIHYGDTDTGGCMLKHSRYKYIYIYHNDIQMPCLAL